MITTLILLTIFSGISFIVYGILSFFSKTMQNEINRWGFKRFKYLLGLCQLIGGVSLLLGLIWLPIASLSSFLLSTMMVSAIYVRIRIGDPLLRFLPAIIFMIINIYILISMINLLFPEILNI